MIDDKRLGLVSSIITVVLFSIAYYGFVWVKEIKIDNAVKVNTRLQYI